MGYSRRQFVTKAFEKIGLASYVYDLEPDQLEAVAEDLNAMMALWDAKGIRLGFPIPGDPSQGDLDDPTNVPYSANIAIYCNLAVLIAPNFGKVPSPELKAMAKLGYDTLSARAAFPPQMQMKVMPTGAGNKFNNLERPFTDSPTDHLEAGIDHDLNFD